MNIECPKCVLNYEVEDSLVNNRVECAACHHKFTAVPVAAKPPARTRRCPFCGETIPLNAEKCRHCGGSLAASLPASCQPKVGDKTEAVSPPPPAPANREAAESLPEPPDEPRAAKRGRGFPGILLGIVLIIAGTIMMNRLRSPESGLPLLLFGGFIIIGSCCRPGKKGE